MKKSELKSLIREFILEYDEREFRYKAERTLLIYVPTSRYNWNDIRSDLVKLSDELKRTHDAKCIKFGKTIGHGSRLISFMFKAPKDTLEVSTSIQKIARNVNPELGDIIRNSKVDVI